ncbi:MAG: serine/threonine-protein kinase [Blastocatellia bacterium]
MNPEKRRLEEIFLAAVEAPAARRAAFCEQACDGDREMRAELERLLEGHDRAERLGFLDDAAWRLRSSHQLQEASQEALPSEDEMIGKTIGQYEIRKKIGEKSGMGDIYLAVEKSQGVEIRRVVIKFAQERLGPNERKRFEDEVRILAALEHNHIARLYNFGVFEDLPYFVMEYVDGVSLHQFIRERGAGGGLPLHLVNEINKQACAGLQFAHDKEVIHRDIKPQNIMVRESNGAPDGVEVKVIDFGIAKASFGVTRRATAGVIGTPNYLSPEQLAPKQFGPVDHRADLYAMGLVVHEMLTGSVVVDGAELAELVHQHLNETPPTPGIHPAVDRAVMTALKKHPNERQPSVRDFAAQLDQGFRQKEKEEEEKKQESLVAPPPPPRKWAWAAAAVLALGVMAGVASQFLPKKGTGGPTTVTQQASPPVQAPVSPSPFVAPPPVERMEPPKITLFRSGRDGREQTVERDTIFHSGESVRFTVVPPRDGFLYLLQQGSSGEFSSLIPDKRIRGGANTVRAGETVMFPPARPFKFDAQPGVETIFVFVAKDKSDPLAAAIEQSLARKKTNARGQVLLDEAAAKLLQASANLSDGKPAPVQIVKLTHEK